MNPIISTQHKPDYTENRVKIQSCDRPPLESPISQSTQLLNLFIQTTGMVIDNRPFPLQVVDSRIASRLKIILNEYSVLNKSVSHWLNTIENCIGRHYIEKEYVVGSAVAYIAGQPLLRTALDIYLQGIPNTLQLFAKLVGKINQKTFSFADVDLRIKVSQECNLEEVQRSCGNFRSDLFYGNMLIIYIGEKDENALDIVVYKELKADSAFNIDDFKLDLKKSDLGSNHVVFESAHPWKWWMGHVLDYLEDYTQDGFRSLLRLLWQESKGRVSILKAESAIFPSWVATMNVKLKSNPEALKLQFEKHQANHDSKVPIADCLKRLKIQQLLRDLSPKSRGILKETTNVILDPSVPAFIKTVFHVMNSVGSDIFAVHGLIECIAKLALYEAWKKPFEVKLVIHEGVWVQRIRFRGVFGKRDLLVRFDVDAAATFLQKTTVETWGKMREIVHALFFEGISQRELSKTYKNVHVSSELALDIKRKLLPFSNTAIVAGTFAKIPLLAEHEISTIEEARILLEVGKLVFHHYRHDPATRSQLCWKTVDKCIQLKGFSFAAELVKLLRDEGQEPVEGYEALFADILLKDGNSYFLYQACSPISNVAEDHWMSLSQSKTKVRSFIALMNELEVSAEIFLKMVRLLHVKNPMISESMLCKILVHDRKKAPQWILAKGKANFAGDAYKTLVSQQIIENKSSFTPKWIKDFIISERFVGTELEKLNISRYLVTKSLETNEKASLLQLFGIRDKECWHAVANDFISQTDEWTKMTKNNVNFDYESLVKWYQIVEECDKPDIVAATLNKIKDHSFRGVALVKILKNWKKRKAEIATLNALDPTKKIPWAIVIEKAENGKDILKALNNVSLPLYSALYRAIKPSEAFYATNWVKMVENCFTLKDIQKPLMTDCLLIHPEVSAPIIRRAAETQEGVLFLLEILNEVDMEILLIMLHACIPIEDGSVISKVFLKFFDSSRHKKPSLYPTLSILSKKILGDPQGDAEAAGKIWEVIRTQANPERLPAGEQLLKLIKSGYSDWVIELINKSSSDERLAVSIEVYSELLACVKDLDKRCVILEGCFNYSSIIQEHWEWSAQADNLDAFSAARLLKSARKLDISDDKIKKCALRCLLSTAIIDESVLKDLLELVPKMDDENAYRFWEILQKSNRYKKSDLWSSGFSILNRNRLHYNLLGWLTKSAKGNNIDLLLSFIDALPDSSRYKSIILPFIKKESSKNNAIANAILWKMDPDEFISGAFRNGSTGQKLNSQNSFVQYIEQLSLYANDAALKKIPIGTVLTISLNLEEITPFHVLLNRIADPIMRELVQGLVVGTRLQRNPAKELVKSYIGFLRVLWNPIFQNHSLEAKINPDATTYFNAPIDDLSSLRFALFDNLNQVIFKSKEFFYEEENIQRFLEVLATCDQRHLYEQMFILDIMLKDHVDYFRKEIVDVLIQFIITNIPRYRSYIRNPQQRNNSEMEKFSAMVTAVLIWHYPERKEWRSEIVKLISLGIEEECARSVFSLGYFASYMALTGSLNGLKKCYPEHMARAVVAAINILCNSNHVEYHSFAKNLLISTTPELLIFYPTYLIEANQLYLDCILDYNQTALKSAIPYAFQHLSDNEMHATCFDMTERDLTAHLKAWGSSKVYPVKDTSEKINELQLELINKNIETILSKRSTQIFDVLDLLISEILPEMHHKYRAFPKKFEDLLIILLKGRKHLSVKKSQFVLNEISVLMSCQPYNWALYNDDKTFFTFKGAEILSLYKIDSNPRELLDFEMGPSETLVDEYLKRNLWCLLTTHLTPKFSKEEKFEWLEKIKIEFILCLYLSKELPNNWAVTSNLLETFGKVLTFVGKTNDAHFANGWLISFLKELEKAMINEKPHWNLYLLFRTIGKNINPSFLPSLFTIETVYSNLGLKKYYFSALIESYYHLIFQGCSEPLVIISAIMDCHCLLYRPRPECVQLIDGENSVDIYYEAAVDFQVRFEFLYISAVSNLFENLKNNVDKCLMDDKEISEWLTKNIIIIMNCTNPLLPRLQSENWSLPTHLVNLILKHLKYLTSPERLDPFITMIFYMKEVLGEPYNLNNKAAAELDFHMILLTICKGPDDSGENTNECLQALRERFVMKAALIAESPWNYIDCNPQLLIWTLLNDANNPQALFQNVIARAKREASFRFIYSQLLSEVRLMIANMKFLRPAYSDWYEQWMTRIQTIISNVNN